MPKKTYRKNNRRGFTLVELLIVVAILGILTTIIVVNYLGAKARARDAKRVVDIETVQTALAMYYADNKAYPLSGADKTVQPLVSECDGLTGTIDTVKTALIPGYLPFWPKDSLNQSLGADSYCYSYGSNGTDYAFILAARGASSEINWIAQPDLIDPVRDGDSDCATTLTDNANITAWKVYTAGGKCW